MNGPTVEAHHRHETRLNITISRVLVVGLLAAIFLLVVGVVLTLVHTGVPVPRKTSIQGIPRALRALEPGGFFQLGLLVLLATPAARVAALFFAYLRRRQWLFSGISFFVFAILVLSAFLGLTT